MGNFRVGIVDGTGAWNDGAYAKEMQFSFCHQIYRQVREPSAKYLRGPSNDGLSVRHKAHTIADWISDQLKRSAKPFPVYLAGYSRGASAVVYAAELLQERKIDVDVMFLFDAVARHVWSEFGGTTIPANVKLALHAMRGLRPDLVNQYEGTINGGLGNPMRIWFGNVALKSLGPRYSVVTIPGTHGAMGGVGWAHVSVDEKCQEDVARFMNAELRRTMGVTLVSHKPTGEPSTGTTTRVVGALDRFAMDPRTHIRSGYESLKKRF